MFKPKKFSVGGFLSPTTAMKKIIFALLGLLEKLSASFYFPFLLPFLLFNIVILMLLCWLVML